MSEKKTAAVTDSARLLRLVKHTAGAPGVLMKYDKTAAELLQVMITLSKTAALQVMITSLLLRVLLASSAVI